MKGQFNAKIAARFTPPKTWVLIEDLSFETDLLGRDEIALLRETSANAVCHGIRDLGIVTCTSGMKLFGRWPASSVPEEPTSEMWTTWKNK